MNHGEALKVAERLVDIFQPACERIEIKGGLSRMKPDVHDIDLLVIPDLAMLPQPRAEFGKPEPKIYKTRLDQLIGQMVDDGMIDLDKNGDRFKKIQVRDPWIMVEISIVLPPATWGVLAVIKTGPQDFSHYVVTRKRSGGGLPNGYRVQNGAVWKGEKEVKDLTGETPIGFNSEIDFLNFLGLGWVEPSERVARWSGSAKRR